MPASVEIIEPERLILDNNDFGGFINDMQARLHATNTAAIQVREKNRFFIKNTAVLLRTASLSRGTERGYIQSHRCAD